jgi:hypothetical protein
MNNMKISWRRLAWVVFVCLYAALFFFNCFRPFPNWLMAYVYTMVLIIWLAYEYYNRHLFFQSGFIPDVLYFWLARALLALFFYSSLVVGIATIIWWPKNQIGVYPITNILGLLLLGYSIYQRTRAFQTKRANQAAVRVFYLSVAALFVSLALGYGSFFLLVYVTVIGLPLVYWSYNIEKRILADFTTYVEKQNTADTKQRDYQKLWAKYTEKKTKKPRKK